MDQHIIVGDLDPITVLENPSLPALKYIYKTNLYINLQPKKKSLSLYLTTHSRGRFFEIVYK